jgi:hypothetical protein
MYAEGYNRQNFYMEENMASPQSVVEIPEKKNQTLLIIAAVAIVLCCCCVILAVAGFFGYTRIRSAEGVPPQPVEEPVLVNPTEAPTGGLGNDILRNDTWQYVAAAAQGRGCDQPIGADTTIVVLQQPQNGVWVEEWDVACASGDRYKFEITFTPDATGTNFDIKSLP